MRKVNETPEETIRRLNIPKVAAKADIKQQGRLETKRAAVLGCGLWAGPARREAGVRSGQGPTSEAPASAWEDGVPELTGAW